MKPETWTTTQRTALNEYLETVVGSATQTGSYYWLDGWKCAIARKGFNVRPYLEQIESCPPVV